ncbi:sporulation phosphorelay system protein KapB [Paenibacillus sp. FSL W7-1287]|uniref:sporulation phosphorelay system protein KapB n=1 Tax=Paenibacillus sp. FSL W7-1287 TaxID=2954538 RepID=UPI0030F5EBEE
MSSLEFHIGQRVTAKVRTGVYIGEIVERYDPRLVVQVLAVVKHPEQGDLHHPYNPDVPMFHERRALAYTEKTTVLPRDVEHYEGDIPDYKESLLHAAQQELEKLDKLNRWTAKSMENIKALMESY